MIRRYIPSPRIFAFSLQFTNSHCAKTLTRRAFRRHFSRLHAPSPSLLDNHSKKTYNYSLKHFSLPEDTGEHTARNANISTLPHESQEYTANHIAFRIHIH